MGNVRFHDDKSLYTGTHGTDGRHAGASDHLKSSHRDEQHGHDEPLPDDDLDDWSGVDAAYEIFIGTHQGLENREFTKICVDCKLVGGSFPKEHCDMVFAKVAGKARKVDKEGF